jgi:CO dehydrogenase/acetyl-CoA synthase beta subunit
MHAVCKNIACLKRLKKQKKFLKSKGKDMVCYSLKTLNELEEAEERERQIETECATTKAAAMLSNVLALSLTKVNPFAGVKVPLLPLEVWA